MTDIVERLRDAASRLIDGKAEDVGDKVVMLDNAAFEIEGLRAEVAQYEQAIHQKNEELAELRAASEWRDISTALEPFVRAAEIIASRPQDYGDRIVAIGGLATAADLTKRHFSDLLASLPAPPQRNEVKP